MASVSVPGALASIGATGPTGPTGPVSVITPSGAVGNGIADDRAVVQAAIDSVAVTGGVLEGQPGAIYGLGSNISIPSDVTVDFSMSTLKGLGGTRNVDIAGTAGTVAVLYQTVDRFSRVVRVATKGVFTVNGWACLYGSPDTDNDDTSKGRAQDLVKVAEVNTANGSYDELTLDRAVEFVYAVAGVATPAVIYPVVPVEHVKLLIGAMSTMQVAPKLCRDLHVEVGANSGGVVISQGTGTPNACEVGYFKFNSEQPHNATSGPNSHSLFKSWRNLQLDCAVFGGLEDGVRIAASSNVDARIDVKDNKARSANLYKISGKVDASVSVGLVDDENVEHVLIDYCNDLEVTARVINILDGDGIELRGRAENITLINPTVIARDDATDLNTCINLHSASVGQRFANTRILGGLLVGSGAYGLLGQDGGDGLLIDGLRAYPAALATSFAPLVLSTGAGFDSWRNVKITNCDLYGMNGGLGLYGSAALPMFDIAIENVRRGPSGTTNVIFQADYTKGLSLSRFGCLGKNAVQRIQVFYATGGTFTLSYKGQTTAAIAYDASAATIKAALDALSTINNVTVAGTNPWTVTFGRDDFIYDTQPDLITINKALLTPTPYGFVWPATFDNKQTRIYNCSGVKISQTERPSSNFFYDFAGTELVETEDLWLTDTPIDQYINIKKPIILDTFTDTAGVLLDAHVADIGGLLWTGSTTPANVTISGNAARFAAVDQILTNTGLFRNYVVDFVAIFAAAVGGAWDQSLLFDYTDTNNKCEVKIRNADLSIALIETIAGVPTTLATYAGWAIEGAAGHQFRVSVNGKYVNVKLGDVTILTGVMAAARSKDTIGWRRNGGSTNASILTAVAVVGSRPQPITEITPQMFRAVGDGVANERAAILAAIAAAGVGGRVYFPKGIYAVNDSISPLAGQTWYGDGVGSVIKQTGTNKNTILITVDDISISELKLYGHSDAGHGILLDSSPVLIKNFDFHRITFDFFGALGGSSSSIAAGYCSRLRVRNCTFLENNICGTGADIGAGYDAAEVTVTGCYSVSQADAFVSLTAVSAVGNIIRHIVTGNIAIRTNEAARSAVIAVYGGFPGFVTIGNNIFEGFIWNGIYIATAGTVTPALGFGGIAITGNIIRYCGGEGTITAGINIAGTNGTVVSGNLIYRAGKKADNTNRTAAVNGIKLVFNTKGATISDNSVVEATGAGIGFNQLGTGVEGFIEGVVINGNSIKDCGGGIGLASQGSAGTKDIIVSNNMVQLNSDHRGFHGLLSSGGSMTGLKLLNNTFITTAVSTLYGAELHTSIRGEIIGNTFRGFANGIYVASMSERHSPALVRIEDNTFDACTNAYRNATTAPRVVILGSKFINGTGVGTGATFYEGRVLGTDASGNLLVEILTDTNPTAGNWYQGDCRRDLTPDASGFIGAVCVTAGAPGTWKTFGAISA